MSKLMFVKIPEGLNLPSLLIPSFPKTHTPVENFVVFRLYLRVRNSSMSIPLGVSKTGLSLPSGKQIILSRT